MALDLDEIDRTILRLLQENARTANAEIGRTVGLSGQSVQERIRKLEIAGIVRGYEANLNPAALGLEVTAFIEITIPTGRNYDEEYKGISAFTGREPEVLEQHGVAGDIDMILKVRCRRHPPSQWPDEPATWRDPLPHQDDHRPRHPQRNAALAPPRRRRGVTLHFAFRTPHAIA